MAPMENIVWESFISCLRRELLVGYFVGRIDGGSGDHGVVEDFFRAEESVYFD